MKQISSDIKSGAFQKVYLLCGEERYLRNDFFRRLREALTDGLDAINVSSFAGAATEPGEIISQIQTLPFFADRRVILVEDSGLFEEKDEELADQIRDLPDYVVLVFSETKADKRGRLYKAVAKAGHAALFDRQKEEVLEKWVLGRIGREKKKIRRHDLAYFLELVGTDMGVIDRELEKLFCYTMHREAIERSDIEAVVTPQIENRIFDMVRAVTNREQKRALGMYQDLLALKEPPMRILYLLAREFNLLYQMRLLFDAGEGAEQIAERLGVKPFVPRRARGLAMRYDRAELRRAISDFARTEEAVKTGRLNEQMAVELMIVKYSAAR